MSNISDMRNIKTPLAWKESLNEKINENKPIKLSSYRKLPVALIAVITLAVLLAGTALAYALTGGAFFTALFEQKAKTDPTNYSYIDISQLPEIAGTTIGMVVDTDELRIDVIDVISSGNDAMIALRVTAKQLDSVLRYTGWDEAPLNNYRFESEDGTLFSKAKFFSYEYIYSDEDHSLDDNQFYFVLTVASLDEFKSGPYSVNFRSFGYYDRLSATGSGVGITTVYQGPWTFELSLSGDTEHNRTVFINQSVDIGKYKYTIEDVYLSPFSCSAVIAYDGAPDLSSDRFKELSDAASDIALYLENETPLKHGGLSAMSGGNHWPDSTYRITVDFAVPVDVDDVKVLHVFGNDYNISPEFNVTSAENLAEAAITPVPNSPSYTTLWTDKKKHDIYTKMLNSIDHYDYASGTFVVEKDGSEYIIDYRVNLLTGEAYEKVINKDGNPIEIHYSDGKILNLINPQSKSYTTQDSCHRGQVLPEEKRIEIDSDGNFVYFYRGDGTNTVYAEYSLFPQGLAMKYLSDENKWYFCGTGDMCDRSCVAIRGTTQETTVDGKRQSITFEIIVDAETGVILQYLCWDSENNITDFYVMKSLSYENPGSFSEVDKSIKELITQG